MTRIAQAPDLPRGLTLTRRGFVQAGGALVVSLAFPRTFGSRVEAASATLDPNRLASWLEIRADNTILARSGKAEMGTGTTGQLMQVIAEELYVRPESVTVLFGDTDGTPDGGMAAGSLWASHNLRKVAAFTHQALLTLASKRLGVPAPELTAKDGVLTGGGKSVTYADLVRGQQLELTIQVRGRLPVFDVARNALPDTYGLLVTGNLPPGVSEPWPPQHPPPLAPESTVFGPLATPRPPMKPMDQYTVVGQSFPSPAIRDKVTAKTEWVGDVRLPGMLHARMVRPASPGSTLVSAGTFDKSKYPGAEVVIKNNLVAVVSPSEWEAVAAARQVAASTKWTAWAGLPGSENLRAYIRAGSREKPSGVRGDVDAVQAKLAASATTMSASYGGPCVRHAPIAGYCAVADVKPDGQVMVWSHSAQPQGHRAYLAHSLGVPLEKVTVRWRDGAAQYGRATQGGDGAEADAAILSQMLGKPVRVQWTLSEDLAWSAVSPGWEADVRAGLDEQGRLTAVSLEYVAPAQGDARMLGSLLAGLPSAAASSSVPLTTLTLWIYDKVPLSERMYGLPNIGADRTSAGLRGAIMRTPGHRQPAFALESMMNEAAAAAHIDPVQFRINHTSDQRLINLLRKTADAAGWQPQSSPARGAARTGAGPVRGQGVGVIMRARGYWVGIAEVEVTPDTGNVRVVKFTVGVDVGKVINPRQLNVIAQGAVVMGLSEALKEEVIFDRSTVKSTDWTRYKIMTMEETPEIKVIQVSQNGRGFGNGSEAGNSIPTQAVAAAFFDATGVVPRTLPLTPAHVKTLLSA